MGLGRAPALALPGPDPTLEKRGQDKMRWGSGFGLNALGSRARCCRALSGCRWDESCPRRYGDGGPRAIGCPASGRG